MSKENGGFICHAKKEFPTNNNTIDLDLYKHSMMYAYLVCSLCTLCSVCTYIHTKNKKTKHNFQYWHCYIISIGSQYFISFPLKLQDKSQVYLSIWTWSKTDSNSWKNYFFPLYYRVTLWKYVETKAIRTKILWIAYYDNTGCEVFKQGIQN